MNSEQISIISNLVDSSLNHAEYHWRNGGYKLIAESRVGIESLNKSVMDSAQSQIPGHEIVREGETIVADFIAIVADMRNSTDHMLTAVIQSSLREFNVFFMKHQPFCLLLKKQ